MFESFWYFAAERQKIFRSRLRSCAAGATGDPILLRFKFTNAYRASDRTSQYLIRRVIHDADRPWRDTFVRVMLFKLFNRSETWELLSRRIGEIGRETFDVERIGSVLGETMRMGERIYSAAYIMPSARVFGSAKKHENHLRLLAAMLQDDVDERIADARSMGEVFNILVSYPSIGPFLGYQFATDLNYAPTLNFTEDEFVVPGPGALDGIAKCFLDVGDLSPVDTIRWTMETQSEQFAARGISFDDLWERPLQLIDCQNLFCEVDKYARAVYPTVAGRSGRTRIKQRFVPKSEPVTAWYPPKWGINDRVHEWLTAAQDERVRDATSQGLVSSVSASKAKASRYASGSHT